MTKGGITYRADIDGLRALAVLSVLGYHAFPGYVTGGFVGVDIFFVISGYLISGIILRGLDTETFSYRDFYARRIRRIFPALGLVLLAVLVVGLFLLLTDEYERLKVQVTAGAFFLSNVLFWQEAGYFDTSAELKPLLHLWSLGIEEQFYILWPVTLVALWRWSNRPPLAIATLMFASFLLNLVLIQSFPTATFYLPATRFWELLLGALVAAAASGRTQNSSLLPLPGLAALIGLALILLSIAFVSDEMLFPGWIAAVPTIGTAMMLAAGTRPLVSRLLAHPLPVFVGLVSYPLYLWHWPVLVFARYHAYGAVPSPLTRLGLLGLSFVLAVGTYWIVEKPIRFGKPSRRKTALLATAIAGIGLMGISELRAPLVGPPPVIRMADLEWNYWQNDACTMKYPWNDVRGWWFCIANSSEPPSLLIIGDSHANHLYPGLVSRTNLPIVSIGTCRPTVGIASLAPDTQETPCVGSDKRAQEAFIDRLVSVNPSIRYAILSSGWPTFASDGRQTDYFSGMSVPDTFETEAEEDLGLTQLQKFLNGIERQIARLEARGITTIVALGTPRPPYDVRACLERPFRDPVANCVVDAAPYRKNREAFVQGLGEIVARHPKVKIFDPMAALCDEGSCRFRTATEVLLRDDNHLSVAGSERVGAAFVAWARAEIPEMVPPP